MRGKHIRKREKEREIQIGREKEREEDKEFWMHAFEWKLPHLLEP